MLPSRWTCSGGARICPTGSQAPNQTEGWGGAATRSPDNGDVLPEGRDGVAKSWVFFKENLEFEFFIKETTPMSGRQVAVGIHSLNSIIHSQAPDKIRKFHRRGAGAVSLRRGWNGSPTLTWHYSCLSVLSLQLAYITFYYIIIVTFVL